MTAATLLAELAHRGATIEADGEDLVLSPVEALDDALLLEARQLKPELLRLLAAPAGFSTQAVCGWCASPLAPYRLDTSRGLALLCPACHRWTVVARPT
jgi:hypothetical protein